MAGVSTSWLATWRSSVRACNVPDSREREQSHAHNAEAELKSSHISRRRRRNGLSTSARPRGNNDSHPVPRQGLSLPFRQHASLADPRLPQACPGFLGDLQKLGALPSTGSGPNMLHKIAASPADNMRSRWPRVKYKLSESSSLREIGPTTVE